MTTALPAIHRDDPAHAPEKAVDLQRWRKRYLDGLAGPYGWWSITALAWTEEGANLLGGAADAQLPLPQRAPAQVAWLRQEGEGLRIEPVAGTDLLVVNGDQAPTPLTAPLDFSGEDVVLQLGTAADAIQAVVMRRFGRHGVRVFDPQQSAARDRDAAVDWFPLEAGFVVEAEVLLAEPGETLPIVNLTGDVSDHPVAGRLRFDLHGQSQTLVATASAKGWFVNFRDASSGQTTYGAGRFLTVASPKDGRTVIDFHRAHHPPCAHSPHAICPLPPLENRLAVAVEAGERYPG